MGLHIMFLADLKHYYTHHMLKVTSQPKVSCDLVSSLMEKNASEFAAQQEWEAEWNQLGLASRLSEEVRMSLCVGVCVCCDCLLWPCFRTTRLARSSV